jgi:hypothetical protein
MLQAQPLSLSDSGMLLKEAIDPNITVLSGEVAYSLMVQVLLAEYPAELLNRCRRKMRVA